MITRTLLLAGAAWATLASSPSFAQEAAPGEAVNTAELLQRLATLEARLAELEGRNQQLEQQSQANATAIAAVDTRTAKSTQFGWAPTFSDPSGDFTFKPRGVVEADVAVFSESEGGYDFSNGTAFRRARLGFEGTAFKSFAYRIEADFAGNAVTLTDAYLQYTKIPQVVLTLGQHKAPFGLESNNSDNYNVFLERGMFTNAFGNAGAERRIGASAAYAPRPNVNLAGGLFGDNESISRSTGSPLTDTPDESWGVNGRATWEPVLETGRILHLGASGFYRSSLKSGDVADAVRFSDRPNIRIDNGNIADSGVITDVDSLRYLGAEAAGVLGPLTVAGEYGRIWLDRGHLADEAFDGFYVYATYFLTGETRPFRGGNFDRVRPKRTLGKDGLGAVELAVRYDQLDLSNTPVAARAGNEAESFTVGLNWYFNPYAKLLLNWIHFNGTNTPIDPVGSEAKGDVIGARVHLDF
jgi:phosphate-selective porin OprO and OprP